MEKNVLQIEPIKEIHYRCPIEGCSMDLRRAGYEEALAHVNQPINNHGIKAGLLVSSAKLNTLTVFYEKGEGLDVFHSPIFLEHTFYLSGDNILAKEDLKYSMCRGGMFYQGASEIFRGFTGGKHVLLEEDRFREISEGIVGSCWKEYIRSITGVDVNFLRTTPELEKLLA
jgi:hypothetical protein